MTDIYIVTSGAYSDYRIESVFSQRDLAEQYAKDIQGNVEVYTVDRYSKREDWCIYKIRMLKDGSLAYEPTTQSIAEEFGRPLGFYCFDDYLCDFIEGTFTRIFDPDKIVLVCNIHTTDEQTAIKATNEYRTIILAHDLWGNTDKARELFRGKK